MAKAEGNKKRYGQFVHPCKQVCRKMHSGAGLFLLELFFWTSKRKVEILSDTFIVPYFLLNEKSNKENQENPKLLTHKLTHARRIFRPTLLSCLAGMKRFYTFRNMIKDSINADLSHQSVCLEITNVT